MPKKFGVKQVKINSTSFTKCHLGQNRKGIICEIFLNMAWKDFDISEEYMSQMIYENYLGIFGMMEMWVASQLRADRVIPLIEKGIFPRKEYWGWSKMEMTRSWDYFEVGKPLGRGIKGDLSRFQDY